MNLHGKKILIIKLRYIGDTLSIVPVVENLRQKISDVIIDVIVNRGTEELISRHPDIRKLWVYNRKLAKNSIISSVIYHIKFIRQLRAEKYDVVVDFTHGDRAAFLSFMTGASQRITYQHSSTLSHILMNHVIRSNPFEHHIVDYQLQALTYFGMDNFKRGMKLYIPESSESKVDHLLSVSGIGRDSLNVMIHPGAKRRLRQWRPERFAEIARRLSEKYRAVIILIGGPEDGNLLDKVEEYMEFQSSFSSVDLSLLEMAALLSRCHLFIGNDSAPAHVAAGVKCPNLTLFGPTFPHMWRPLSPIGEVVFKDVPCCGCMQKSCIRPEKTCMDLIEVDEVWEKVEGLMKEAG